MMPKGQASSQSRRLKLDCKEVAGERCLARARRCCQSQGCYRNDQTKWCVKPGVPVRKVSSRNRPEETKPVEFADGAEDKDAAEDQAGTRGHPFWDRAEDQVSAG